MGFRVLLQGEKSPKFVETRIEACFDTLRRVLDDMSSEEFETSRRSLVGKQVEKPKSLYEESQRYWTHMRDGDYDFGRRELCRAQKLAQER